MYDVQQRAFLRAASRLWQMAAETSRTHPSESPALKAIFMSEDVLPPTNAQIDALVLALETEIIYTTVTLAAEKYNVSKATLRRRLDAFGYKPVPGSKVYSMADVLVAVNDIREGKARGFFG